MPPWTLLCRQVFADLLQGGSQTLHVFFQKCVAHIRRIRATNEEEEPIRELIVPEQPALDLMNRPLWSLPR